MKLVICGDLSVTDKSREVFSRKDVCTAFGDTLPLYRGADFAILNLECDLTDSDHTIKKCGPNLKGPKETADTLKAAGFTDCALSNNHIFDYGKKGLRDTLCALDRVSLRYTGIGENYEDSRRDLILEKDGVKIAIVNVCEHEYSYATDKRMGARPFDPFESMADIRRAKEAADRVVVIYHGGKEHCLYPSPRLFKACREMVHCGADAVLCQHSHAIGVWEEYEGAHILYGQGNFHFPRFLDTPYWDNGLIVSLDIDKEKNEISFYPIAANDEGGIQLLKGEEKETLMAAFYERSKSLKDGSYLQRWREFCLSMKAHYSKLAGYSPDADEDETQLFAHCLDCEAHNDVWRELFKTYNETNELFEE